ncbi:MAG: hypothetical protein ABSE49_05540 [Polyangiaceae bacterium]
MNREGSKVAIVAVASALLVTCARAATADVTKAQCIDADTTAQALRRDGKFTDARAALDVCSDPKCPTVVRDDCTRQLDALAEVQPTVVLDAKDPKGTDVSSVRVRMDGRPLAEKLDGTPVAVDRGEHQFSFEAGGGQPVTLTVVVKDGEKRRLVSVTVGVSSGSDTGTGTGTGKGAGGGDHPTSSSTQRTLGLVLGGAGVVGLGVGAVFGALAASKWSATKNDCAVSGACPSYSQAVSDHAATASDATISTVGVIGGAALLAAGLTLYFTSPSAKTTTVDAVGIGPGTLILQGRFQ